MANSNKYWLMTCIYFVATFFFVSSFAARDLSNIKKDFLVIPHPSGNGRSNLPARDLSNIKEDFLIIPPSGSGSNLPDHFEKKPKGGGRPPSPNPPEQEPCYPPFCFVDEMPKRGGGPNAPDFSEKKPKGGGRPPSPNPSQEPCYPPFCFVDEMPKRKRGGGPNAPDFSEKKPKGGGRPPSPNQGSCYPFCSGEKP